VSFDIDDELGHKSLAVHEASHAVVAWDVGLRIVSINLVYGWLSGDLKEGYCSPAEDWTEEKAAEWATVYHAGSIGQEKFLRAEGVSPALASQIATYSGGMDAGDVEALRQKYEFSDSAARDRAECLVDAGWSQIQEVATMLMDQHRLSGTVAR
jgi:hypothetical protein